MGNIFAGSEIVELGIQIEKNGRDFYNILAGTTKSEKVKSVFQYLSKEEEKHIKIFQKLLSTTDRYEPPAVYADEYFAYMDALANEYIFTQKGKGELVAKRIKTDKEAVDSGIGFEKDSIIFYEGMKKVVPDYDHEIVDELISQEQSHLRQLSELKKQL